MQSQDSTSAENDDTISFSPSRGKAPLFSNVVTSTSDENDDTVTFSPPQEKALFSSNIVTAAAGQAEKVPTIPLGTLQTINAREPEVAVRSVATTRSVRLPPPLVAPPSEYHRTSAEWLQVWWEGIRPAYLLLPLMPVLLGSILSWLQTITAKAPFGHFRLSHFIVTLCAVAFLQIGANLVNDYYDYIKGIDTSNQLGPGSLIQQGLIKPGRVLSFGLLLLFLGALLGIVVALSGGLFVFLFGIIGLLCAYFYSATSRALSSITLGELVAFCIYGPLITLGAYAVQAGAFPGNSTLLSVLLYSIPPGLLATAFVHVNNMRDVESDLQAEKRTLAGILGFRMSRTLYLLLLLGAYAIITALAIPRGAPHLVLLTWWTLPSFLVAITGVFRADMPTNLHSAMGETLKLFSYFALLLVIALIGTAIIPILPHLPSHLLPF
ncbi:MAG: 1,4-dihydroxy-2-naphthoate octaprenyltransferase [Chloroflexota bacterium]|nr:1,4-dihydroxy-2-naphthoate octaprenyltransferase [Chloroflexota bacterium]